MTTFEELNGQILVNVFDGETWSRELFANMREADIYLHQRGLLNVPSKPEIITAS